MTAAIFKASLLLAATSVAAGGAIDVQVSGAQVIGWAVGAVGFLLAGLISLVGWFASKQFGEIRTTLESHGEALRHQDGDLREIKTTLGGVVEWKKERQRADDEAKRETVKSLEEQLRATRGAR